METVFLTVDASCDEAGLRGLFLETSKKLLSAANNGRSDELRGLLVPIPFNHPPL